MAIQTITVGDQTAAADRDGIAARLCRLDFEYFAREFWECVPGAGTVTWNWHMTVICQELQKIALRVFRGEPAAYDCLINISPGSSKSTLASILFHPWTWTRMPTARHLNASHTEALVHDLANKAREVIRSEKYRRYFPEIELRTEQDAKGYYMNSHGGSRYACTVGGKSPMGFHAHFLMGDDLIDPQKVLSEAERESAKDFVTNGLPTRMVDKAVSVVFLIMQRLGRGDPAEVMQDISKRQGARPLHTICLPAELTDKVEPAALRDKYTDGLMDPVRLPRHVLDAYKARDAFRYSAQFLQCMPADVWVRTAKGDVLIRDVVEGDWVLTRKGYQRVKWSGQTGVALSLCSVMFSDGKVVTGTPEHPVWTNNAGWIPLDYLRGGEYVTTTHHQEALEWEESQLKPRKSSNSTEPGIAALAGTPISRTILPGAITSTGTCGGFTVGTFPTVTISITLTGTRLTIGLTTWSVSPSVNTDHVTQTVLKNVERFLTPSALLVFRGIRRKRVASIIRRLVRRASRSCGRTRSTTLTPVRIAAEFTGPGTRKKLSIVPQSVKTGPGVREVTTRVVRIAENLSPRESLGRSAALEDVPLLCGVPVYDLTVDSCPEFFANGVLVHNCPLALGGGMFQPQYFSRVVKAAPFECVRIRYFDRASSVAEGACYTAGVLFARDTDGNYYVEDVVHGKWEPNERNQVMRATAIRDRLKYGPRYEPMIYVEAEGGSSGRDAWLGVVRALAGFNVREDRPTGSKDARAEPLSCQFAAGNVYLVQGDWDIDGYIKEFLLFRPEPGKRLGGLKDRVDATSGAFNLMVKMNPQAPLRVFNLVARKKKKTTRFVVCSRDDLHAVAAEEQPSLLVYFTDPAPRGNELVKPDGLGRLMDAAVIRFADIDPKDFQADWDSPLPDYGAPPADLVMGRDAGKKLWSFLLRQRGASPEVVVFCDDGAGDGRAYSAACGVCDMLRLKRGETIWLPAKDAFADAEPKNAHVVSVVKATRCEVM